MASKVTGVRRVLNAYTYSIQGLRATWKYEAAFRQEVVLVCILLPLALWLGRDGAETAMLILPLFIVVIVEVINSAIEAVVDRIGSETNELAGRAKDMGSAAVFLSLLMTMIIWVLILGQRLVV